MSESSNVKITPLGGLGEIGKNVTVFETDDDMIIVDCGCKFPSEDTPGIAKIYPDLTYIKERENKIRGIIITHGHEDHIGALVYLMDNLFVTPPIYCSDFTAALLYNKRDKSKINNKIHIVSPGNKKKISNDFQVEFIHVNHSIPGAFALAIQTPQGMIIHTGDFKIDTQPVRGEMCNLTRFGQLGEKGVRLLLMDSTNSEDDGWSTSEYKVSKTLENVFNTHKDKRIIISAFSSNVYRLNKIIQLSELYGRKVAIVGRSIENTITASISVGIISIKKETLITIDRIEEYEPEKVTVICTGAQGEITSALSRMAEDTHPAVQIEPNDVIIISSHPIPGNGKKIDNIISRMYEHGAIVLSYKNADIHASGHANKEEQKMMLALTKPQFYMPVHGEPLHLRAARRIGAQMGLNKKNIITTKTGNPIVISQKGINKCPTVQSGEIYIDGDYGNELNIAVIKDRQVLMSEGVVIVSAVIDEENRTILSPVMVNSRGFIYMNDSVRLVQDISQFSRGVLERLLRENMTVSDIKVEMSKKVAKQIFQATSKSPIVLIMLNSIEI